MTKRKLIIHTIIYLFILANAVPIVLYDVDAGPFFWIALVLTIILFIIDIMRLVKYGIKE